SICSPINHKNKMINKMGNLKLSMGYLLSVFVKELPGCILFAGIFAPVTLLLLLLIAYFRIKLLEGRNEGVRLACEHQSSPLWSPPTLLN
uniref:Uncharacterized protein n=1 Tax=Dromaius novaehollandiae TaxID=8790 RepID=A0A8C4P851_DRONO